MLTNRRSSRHCLAAPRRIAGKNIFDRRDRDAAFIADLAAGRRTGARTEALKIRNYLVGNTPRSSIMRRRRVDDGGRSFIITVVVAVFEREN
jgi:hypothetical protein